MFLITTLALATTYDIADVSEVPAVLSPGDVLSLTDDLTGEVVLPDGVTLQGNGFSLTSDAGFAVTLGNDAVVRDLVVQGGVQCWIADGTTGVLVEDVVCRGQVATEGIVHIVSGASVTCDDCVFERNQAGWSTVRMVSGDATFNRPVFRRNRTAYGGAFRVFESTLFVDGAVVEDNSATHGGAIRVDGGAASALDVRNSSFVGNVATNNGGAIYAVHPIVVADSVFEGNVSNTQGGAIFSNASVDIAGSTFRRNRSASLGGAVRTAGGGSVVGSTFCGNHAFAQGGALYALTQPITVEDSVFARNVGAPSGGAVNIANAGASSVTSNTFFANDTGSGTSGGGVFVTGGSLVLERNLFVGHRAAPAHVQGGATLTGPLGNAYHDNLLADSGNPLPFVTIDPRFPVVTGGCDALDLRVGTVLLDLPTGEPYGALGRADADGDGVFVDEDCDDGDGNVFPGALEVPCDGVDNDCDPATLDVAVAPRYLDLDGDGYGWLDTDACDPLGVELPGDCDDARQAVSPGMPEVTCDGLDNDCDPTTEDERTGFHLDIDGDGFGDPALPSDGCGIGEVEDASDCDDRDEHVHPGVPEVACDGIDNDCDPDTLDGDAVTFEDRDGDGWGSDVPATCGSGVVRAGDCDDDDPARSPGQLEACNGIDDDCDGTVDPDLERAFWPDADGDGFGDMGAVPSFVCAPPDGHVRNSADCADDDPDVRPGADNACDDCLFARRTAECPPIVADPGTGCSTGGGGLPQSLVLALVFVVQRRRRAPKGR